MNHSPLSEAHPLLGAGAQISLNIFDYIYTWLKVGECGMPLTCCTPHFLKNCPLDCETYAGPLSVYLS